MLKLSPDASIRPQKTLTANTEYCCAAHDVTGTISNLERLSGYVFLKYRILMKYSGEGIRLSSGMYKMRMLTFSTTLQVHV